MAKDIHDSERVSAYVQQLDRSVANTVNEIRKIILSTDKQIGEQIKWNAPSFFYTGEMQPFDPKEYKRDITVMNLRNKEYVLLVFPTGAKVIDTTGLLEGAYTDGRRMVKIADVKDARNKKKALQIIIKAWLDLVKK